MTDDRNPTRIVEPPPRRTIADTPQARAPRDKRKDRPRARVVEEFQQQTDEERTR